MLKGLANGIVFVEVEVAVKVLQNNLIHAVVATEDIEVMDAIDVDRSQEIELLGRVTIQGDLADGVQGVVTGGEIVRHCSWRCDIRLLKSLCQFLFLDIWL
jgi:hypothetical protein